MLKKQLGLFSVFSIAAGAMISSGLFVLPGIAFAKAGPAIILAYALAGLLMIPVLLAKAELVTAMPKSGGSYFFIERTLGPVVGTIAGFAIWFSIALKATFAVVGIGALAAMLLPNSNIWTIKLIAAAACIVFTAINVLSVKGTGRLQIFLVVILIAILLLYFVKALAFIEVTRYSPFAPFGIQSIFAVAGMVFVSFGGLTKVIDISEEVRNSKKNIPLGMFFAFITVNLLYLLIVFVTVGLVPPEQLSGSLMPISLGAKIAMAKPGAILVAIAALMAFATTANAGILSASRTPMAMSRDGLLPQFLARTGKRYKTPHLSLALTGSFMVLVVLTLSVENLIKTASTMMILMFMLMNVAVIIMRYSGMQTYRPTFKAPLNPWLQIATIIIYIFLILEMGFVPLAITTCFALAALLWYIFYVQRRIDRESAIVYLVKGIVSRHIQRSTLEEELKQISLQRDEITPDRFDDLVKKCDILDIEGKLTAQDFFHRAAESLSPRLDVDPDIIYNLFIEREKESTTVVKPGLAIPHIVIQGQKIFDILLIRCRDGVTFSELHEPVKTAFVLIGSSDERNYHLRALMHIAHIVSEEDFEQRWFKAKNPEQLRDILLLSKRKRE